MNEKEALNRISKVLDKSLSPRALIPAHMALERIRNIVDQVEAEQDE